MLTLRGPITLTSGKLRPSFTDSLGERISANYALASARFTPEELLFLMSAPAELELPEPSMTSITFHSRSSSTQAVTLEIINNVVNRLLLENTPHFTYQDQVYITRVLNRLGITDCSLFLRQVQSLREENLSVRKLLSLYSGSLTLLKSLEREGRPRQAETLPVGGEAEPGTPAPVYTLQDSVYNRLETLRIYQTLQRFQRNQGDFLNRLSRTELLSAEQYRVSQSLALSQYKQETAFAQEMELHHHLNQFESGELLEPPRTEEQVLSQSAAAALIQVVDSVSAVRAGDLLEGARFWMDLSLAVRQSVENALRRYRFYHTEPHLLTALDGQIQQELTALYQQESSLLIRLTQSFPALEYALHKDGGTLPEEREPLRETRTAPSPEAPPSAVEASGALERERINQTTEQLLQGIQPPVRSESLPPLELSAPSAQGLAGEPEQQAIRRSGRLLRLWERIRQGLSALNRQELRLARAGTDMAPVSAPSGELRELRELVYGSHTLRESETRILRQLEQAGGERGSSGVPGEEGPEGTDGVWPETELELPASPAEGETPAGEAGERLVRQLEEIDHMNRERLERLRESISSRSREQTLLQPDKQRIFRDALQGLDAPEEVLNAFYQEAQESARTRDPQVEAALAQADEATRRIYEAVLRYQAAPQAAVQEGLLHPVAPELLNRELSSGTELRQPDPLERVYPAAETEPEVQERVEQVAERFREHAGTASGPVRQLRREQTELIHRTAETAIDEELLERLSQRQTVQINREELRTETPPSQTVIQPDITRLQQQTAIRVGEDVTELVNRTLARKMDTIAERVCSQMERKLQTERARRGRL